MIKYPVSLGLLAALTLTLPAAAQNQLPQNIQRSNSQDFFEGGRQRIEQGIERSQTINQPQPADSSVPQLQIERLNPEEQSVECEKRTMDDFFAGIPNSDNSDDATGPLRSSSCQ